MAASSSTLVISNGTRYASNSGRATLPTIPCSAAARAIASGGSRIAAGGPATRSTPSWKPSTPASATPTPRPSGPLMSVAAGRPRLSSMMTNRNSTMMAPPYTSTWSTAMNWASSTTNNAASEHSVTTSHRALATVDGILGADMVAVAAERAAELIDLVDQRIAVALLVVAGQGLDAVGGTDLRAQPAGHALGASLLVGEHAVRAPPARGERPVPGALLLGVLHRDPGPKQVLQRQHHALERGPHVRHLRPRPPHHLDTDRHQACPPSAATEPATMCPRSSTKNSGIASSALRANSVSANRVS